LWTATHSRLPHPANDNPASGIRSKPVVENDRAYYVSNRGELVCVDVNGFSDNQNAGPFRDEVDVRPGAVDILWMVDPVSQYGVFKRDAEEFGNPLASPVIDDQSVYFITGNGSTLGYQFAFPNLPFVPNSEAPSLICVNKMTGQVQWKCKLPGKNIAYGQWASPVLAPARVGRQLIFPGGDGILYSLDPANGKELWRSDCHEHDKASLSGLGATPNAGFIATPTISGSHVFAVRQLRPDGDTESTQFALHAIDIGLDGETQGKLKWSFAAGRYRGSVSSPLVVDGQVLLMSVTGHLFSISAESGKELWNLELGDPNSFFAGPFINRGLVYVPLSDQLAVLDPKQKRICGLYSFNDRLQGQPTLVEGVLYAATNKEIFAIRKLKLDDNI
jgi:outer membrane protein assembly factor BamB